MHATCVNTAMTGNPLRLLYVALRLTLFLLPFLSDQQHDHAAPQGGHIGKTNTDDIRKTTEPGPVKGVGGGAHLDVGAGGLHSHTDDDEQSHGVVKKPSRRPRMSITFATARSQMPPWTETCFVFVSQPFRDGFDRRVLVFCLVVTGLEEKIPEGINPFCQHTGHQSEHDGRNVMQFRCSLTATILTVSSTAVNLPGVARMG